MRKIIRSRLFSSTIYKYREPHRHTRECIKFVISLSLTDYKPGTTTHHHQVDALPEIMREQQFVCIQSVLAFVEEGKFVCECKCVKSRSACDDWGILIT